MELLTASLESCRIDSFAQGSMKTWYYEAHDAFASPLWSRFLQKFAGAPCGIPADAGEVFRIDRTADALWTVTRPGATLEHGFADLGAAVCFIRHEAAGMPATVELRVDGVYAVGYIHPGDGHSLFGEAA